MLAFIFKRLLQSVVVMLTVALIAFALFRYVGDPINNMVGQDTTLEERAELKERLGLNDPFIIQFYRFVRDASVGEFGLSYQHRRPVKELIAERLPATLELALVSAILALAIGIPITSAKIADTNASSSVAGNLSAISSLTGRLC